MELADGSVRLELVNVDTFAAPSHGPSWSTMNARLRGPVSLCRVGASFQAGHMGVFCNCKPCKVSAPNTASCLQCDSAGQMEWLMGRAMAVAVGRR